MSRRRGSATALNASEVVAALAMLSIYSHIGICQALFLPSCPPPFFLCCVPLKMGLSQVTGYSEIIPPAWLIVRNRKLDLHLHGYHVTQARGWRSCGNSAQNCSPGDAPCAAKTCQQVLPALSFPPWQTAGNREGHNETSHLFTSLLHFCTGFILLERHCPGLGPSPTQEIPSSSRVGHRQT